MHLNLKNILVETEGHLQTITINRPSKLNALNQATIEELSTCIQAAENDPKVKVIIMTGAGKKAFVAGADISEFSNFSIEQGKALSQKGHHELFNLIDKLSKPVIAAVNGFALGGGLELALSAHVRVFAENALVGLPETSLGIIPGYGGTQRLAQIAGKGRAMHMILSAEMIDAAKALDYGITTSVVPQEDLAEAAIKMANKIMRNAPSALSKAIQCINASYAHEIDGFDYEINTFGSCFNTPEFKEGTMAFLEKRKANF